VWRHDASGWEVQHCGHPTALYPYYAVDPAHPETATVTHNGRGFRTLEVVFDAIEGVLAGRVLATDHNCVPGVRRIANHAERGCPCCVEAMEAACA